MTPPRYLSAAEVRAALPMAECIDAMDAAMRATSRGAVGMPVRTFLDLPDERGAFGLMPATSAELSAFAVKVVSLLPGNPTRGRPAIQGFVALFDGETGEPVAFLEGAELTALRTAAASGLATRVLARQDAQTLGLFGCGVQARTHLEAMRCARELREVVVWGRSAASAERFVEEALEAQSGGAGDGLRIVATTDPERCAACDLVCTVTASPEPVLRGAWLRPGAHVNLVGAHTAETREADGEAIRRASVWVDSLAGAAREAGDLLLPQRLGEIEGDPVIGEIGQVLLGEARGRSRADEITLYESLGVAAQDLYAARRALEVMASEPGR